MSNLVAIYRGLLRLAIFVGGAGVFASALASSSLGQSFPSSSINYEEAVKPKVTILNPPEDSFFSKMLVCHGIPIKAHRDVGDSALFEAYGRISRQLAHQPGVLANLLAAGAQFHIIGQRQVTSDLPEYRSLKNQSLHEFENQDFGGQTIDQRTRGLGGLIASCGEENLLRLMNDRYRGYDICVHEFSHDILLNGVPQEFRDQVEAQYARSLKKGLWKNSYAGTNSNEFFAELSTWYFGAHGDLAMSGTKPANGPAGLRLYDPEAYTLLDAFYSGRLKVPGPEANR